MVAIVEADLGAAGYQKPRCSCRRQTSENRVIRKPGFREIGTRVPVWDRSLTAKRQNLGLAMSLPRARGERNPAGASPVRPDWHDRKLLLAPYASEKMIWWLVSPRVGNVKNNDPRLIAPIAAVG